MHVRRHGAIAGLKCFLDYAERGPVALPSRDEGSLGPTESPFEEAVTNALGVKGWEVRTQVGVSGFRVDLGVVRPDYAGSYIAGVSLRLRSVERAGKCLGRGPLT